MTGMQRLATQTSEKCKMIHAILLDIGFDVELLQAVDVITEANSLRGLGLDLPVAVSNIVEGVKLLEEHLTQIKAGVATNSPRWLNINRTNGN